MVALVGEEGTFVQQLPLANKYQLLVVDMCGYGESPVTDDFGFDSQSRDIAELLGRRGPSSWPFIWGRD